MKKLIYSLLIGLVLVSAIVPSTQKKVALIVAIGEYPEGGRWRNLSSMNDMHYVKSALQKSGFANNDIDTLVNQQATKKGIVKALDDLYNKVNEGDIVYFQFSGHGQQIQDDNGDEVDGYDEALICYDAAAAYDPVTYHGENHLRDDLLGEKLNKIRKKIGLKGSLVVLIDACHSGTATRDAGIKRGIEIPFQEPGYKAAIKIDLSHNPEQGMLEGFTEGMGSMIVFSACSPNQPNYEMKDADRNGVGSLSYAFAKSIADLPAESNYNVLFQKMKAMIQGEIPTQIPMVEGNLDLEVFGGKYTAKPEIIAVEQKFNNQSNKFNDTTFIINQGELNSLNKGSTLKIYEVGSSEVYAEGVITQTSSFQSICKSDKHLQKNTAYEVKIDAANNGDFSAAIMIQNNETKSKKAGVLEAEIKNFMKPYQFLSLSTNPDFTLDISKTATGGYTISLMSKGDSIHYVKNVMDSVSQDDWKYFLDGIKRSMRVKYLRNMVDGGAFAKDIKVEIVPKVPSKNQGQIILKSEDEFEIRITNNGTQDYYYTVIDIMPNNEMKILLPDDTKEAADYVIHPKESIPISGISVDTGMPNGIEMFKVIVTKTPVDLRGVVNRKTTRGTALKPIEKMMDDLFKDGNDARATRSSMTNVKVDEVGVISCGFSIKN